MSAWRPTASWPRLRARAELFSKLRRFFAARGVLEVDVPLLDRRECVASGLRSLSVSDRGDAVGYLQTSPEHAMKRLVAAGSGPIYQLGKAFRAGELGHRHLPEFTMLEWYRPHWSSSRLMDEVAALLHEVADAPTPKRWRYRELFERRFGVNPHRADAETLRELARERLGETPAGGERDDWLELLFESLTRRELDGETPHFVRDFPASQAELAQLVCDGTGTLVADRFEVYWKGLELGNGYGELRDVEAHRRRFARERRRQEDSKSDAPVDIDAELLDALRAGLPACAGAALGADRLLMLVTGADDIRAVVPFAPLRRD